MDKKEEEWCAKIEETIRKQIYIFIYRKYALSSFAIGWARTPSILVVRVGFFSSSLQSIVAIMTNLSVLFFSHFFADSKSIIIIIAIIINIIMHYSEYARLLYARLNGLEHEAVAWKENSRKGHSIVRTCMCDYWPYMQ